MRGIHRTYEDIGWVTRAGATVAAMLLVALSVTDRVAHAQGVVKVTPLGSHDGELCSDDRAVIFEDPMGVRILYDPGRRVDENDPRLGDIHVNIKLFQNLFSALIHRLPVNAHKFVRFTPQQDIFRYR